MAIGFRGGSGSRVGLRQLVFVVILVALALLVASIWSDYRQRQQQQAAIGAMLQSFKKANALTVFQAQVPVIVESTSCIFFCRIKRTQIGIIPTQVDYKLELSAMKDHSMAWDAERQTMSVTIPDVVIGKPILDASRARFVNDGIMVTGNEANVLARANMAKAETLSAKEAANPQLLQLARTAAKEATQQNILLPLRAAGYTDAKVEVRLAAEGYQDKERWDVSRRPEEVVQEKKNR